MVKRDGSGWLDGWPRLKKGKMTNHKKHNNITHTKRWEERRWKIYVEPSAVGCTKRLRDTNS